MTKSFIWLSEKEASELLKVEEKTLGLLRLEGYLKPGSHWKSSNDPEQLPWNPKVFYCIGRCKEVLESLKNNYSSFDQKAA
tara:strand:+ start:139 stop:381 length:243 start_codon:yes stop_codon:yes gene_type:complete